MKILILDDDPVIVHYFYAVLEEKYGSQVEIYATTCPETALGVVDSHIIDLAFLDVRMPGIDGYDFMRMMNGRLRGVKFITAVASDLEDRLSDEDKEKCTVIAKPIKASRLLTEVDSVLTDWMLHEMVTSLRDTRAYCANFR